MHKEGVKNYKKFTEEALENSSNLPISFEVFSDDLKQMEKEARIIHSWGGNSYVKIPITNTKGKSTKNVIKNLTNDGIKVNVTAIFTIKQLIDILNYFQKKTLEKTYFFVKIQLFWGAPTVGFVFVKKMRKTTCDLTLNIFGEKNTQKN